MYQLFVIGISIHALLAESDAVVSCISCLSLVFLSTLSLRRATGIPGPAGQHSFDFYPRSPCGERQVVVPAPTIVIPISIHALLAESDRAASITPAPSRNFYPRSPCGERRSACCGVRRKYNFYPRSPCGERPANEALQKVKEVISIHALLAESDQIPRRGQNPPPRFLSTLSLRRATAEIVSRSSISCQFLSTLSLRRATDAAIGKFGKARISIHALLAESDLSIQFQALAGYHFYPRSPCGERRDIAL